MLSTLYSTYLKSHKVTTDSRAITPGCIFFAFKGEHFDGNAFAPKALEQGAALCVVSDPQYAADPRCILVPDVLQTLQQLAAHHRQQQSIPFIGITGTNGKTTTKELVHAVLSKRYRTHATAGNFNNHLGVPLTLLALPEDAEMAIIEMGANHPGEIDFLCHISQPEYGLITNVGKAHLAGFGSFEGVIKTKTELYRAISANKGTLFVNADNEHLLPIAQALATIADEPSAVPGYIPGLLPEMGACHAYKQVSLVSYGNSESAECHGSLIGSNPYMKFYFEVDDNVYNVQTQLLGDYNFDNAMAAVAVGLFFGVEPFDIKNALEEYVPSNNRSQFKHTEHNDLILDCYNANPSSMKVAVENLAAMQASYKVAILGSMKELGPESEKEHRALVNQLLAANLNQIVLVGTEFDEAIPDNSNIIRFDTSEQAKDYLKEYPLRGATILLKGSNSNKMWQLEEVL